MQTGVRYYAELNANDTNITGALATGDYPSAGGSLVIFGTWTDPFAGVLLEGEMVWLNLSPCPSGGSPRVEEVIVEHCPP